MDEDKQQKEIATALCRHGKQYDQYCYACAIAGMQKAAGQRYPWELTPEQRSLAVDLITGRVTVGRK